MACFEGDGASGGHGGVVAIVSFAHRVQQSERDVSLVLLEAVENQCPELLDGLGLRGEFADLVDGLHAPVAENLLGGVEGGIVEALYSARPAVQRGEGPRKEG